MGSGFSSFLLLCNSTTGAPATLRESGLGDLPESVVGSVLVYLNPQDICRLASVNRAFRSASCAEFVWELKLPNNYEMLINRVFGDDGSCKNLCKKEIYAKLTRPNAIDGGTKWRIRYMGMCFCLMLVKFCCFFDLGLSRSLESDVCAWLEGFMLISKVWLDKGTGKACVLISSNGLAITGIDDRRYWNWISTEESRFRSVAYLQQIWWFEVDGEVEFPFPCGTYSLYFRLQLGRSSRWFGRRVCNLDHVHGWDIKPVKFQLSTSDGQKAINQCYLTSPGKWNIYRVGDFVVEDSKVPMKIKFSMTQIDCTHTKGGLCVDSVLIRPK